MLAGQIFQAGFWFFLLELVVLMPYDCLGAPSAVLVHKMTTGDMHSLLRRIFTHYDKEVMPTRPVLVHLDVLLLRVKSTVEKEGIFESVIALFIDWHDRRMVWNPLSYDNISLLAFDSEKVWLPDIALTNSADHLYSISRDFRFVVRVTSDGMLKFVPTGTARTWCQLRLLTFPFDIQTCSLEFESWSLEAETLQFDANGHLVVDPSFGSNQWHLCNYTSTTYNHTYDFTGETFARIRFDFTVRRKSTFYMLNIVFPCATLSLIQLLVFVIPSCETTSDRIGFGTTNLLTLVVFQTIATEEMPKTSDAVTSLSKYIIALIILASFGIFESVIVERMLRIVNAPPPPIVLKLSHLVPILWREKAPIRASLCTDEVLAKNLLLLPIQAAANAAKRRQYLQKKDVAEQQGSVSNGRTASGGRPSIIARAKSAMFSNRSSQAFFPTMMQRSQSRNGYSWIADGDSQQGRKIAAKCQSPIWESYRLKRPNNLLDVPSPNDGRASSSPFRSRLRSSPTSSGAFGSKKKNRASSICFANMVAIENSETMAIKEENSSDESGSESNKEEDDAFATRKMSSVSVSNFGTDRSYDSDWPETRSQIETAIARPSILIKPRNQRQAAYARSRIQQQRNALLWAEIVTRVDIVSFAVCTFLALCVPLVLFLPLVSISADCAAGANS